MVLIMFPCTVHELFIYYFSVFSFPYYIIATDYNNYALAYSCVNIDDDYRGGKQATLIIR